METPLSWFRGKKNGEFHKGKNFNPDNKCRKKSALNPWDQDIQASIKIIRFVDS